MAPARFIDRTAGWLGVAFVVTLLLSEAVLSLPDEDATSSAVADFYATHRGVIIGLQVAGFVACALLAGFAWRLRPVGRGIAITGLVLAVTTLAPGLITLVLAVVADPRRPGAAGDLNRLEPRGDDLIFIGVVLFAVTVALLLGRAVPWLGALAWAVALCCVLRLALEALGGSRGVLESLAPISFLVLVVALSVLAFRGYPTPARVTR